MPMYSRAGERTPPNFRTDRLYQVDGNWYFVTREKTREGPFQTKIDAGVGVDRYVTRMRTTAR